MPIDELFVLYPLAFVGTALLLGQAAGTSVVQFAAFRDMLGIGRKRSIQILEYFDRIGFTRRVAEQRHIRADSALAQQYARH